MHNTINEQQFWKQQKTLTITLRAHNLGHAHTNVAKLIICVSTHPWSDLGQWCSNITEEQDVNIS